MTRAEQAASSDRQTVGFRLSAPGVLLGALLGVGGGVGGSVAFGQGQGEELRASRAELATVRERIASVESTVKSIGDSLKSIDLRLSSPVRCAR